MAQKRRCVNTVLLSLAPSCRPAASPFRASRRLHPVPDDSIRKPQTGRPEGQEPPLLLPHLSLILAFWRAVDIFTGAVWDGLAGKPGPEVVWESNYVGAAPGFIDEAALDFRLKPDSPCIDAGQDEPELTDGYRGKHPDAGAYETSI